MIISIGGTIIHEDWSQALALPASGQPWHLLVPAVKAFTTFQGLAEWLEEAKELYPSTEVVRLRREAPNGDYDELELHAISTLTTGELDGLTLHLTYEIRGLLIGTRVGNIHAVTTEGGEPLTTEGGSVVTQEVQL